MKNAMCFWTKLIPWANWQISLLKISVMAFGIILGATYAEFWRPLLWLVGLVFVVTAIWVTILWLRAMRKT